jgi:hypothetical protein
MKSGCVDMDCTENYAADRLGWAKRGLPFPPYFGRAQIVVDVLLSRDLSHCHNAKPPLTFWSSIQFNYFLHCEFESTTRVSTTYHPLINYICNYK